MSDQEELHDENGNPLFEHHRHVAQEGHEQIRVDKFLMSRISNMSRNKIQNAANQDLVRVNGNVVKVNYKVKPLDEVVMMQPFPVRNKEIIPQDIPINVVYEDKDLVIVNKEPGMVVHPSYGHYSGTLVNALAFRFDNLPESSDEGRPGLVHRLDKNTSGIMMVAKNEHSMMHLSSQFYNRTTDRTYQALVWGDFDEDSGTITGNIGRSLQNRKIMDIFPEGDYGKHAVTHYRVLERFGYVTLVECKLETGRTHQIRAHFKYIGHPIFNDEVYGGDKILKGTTFSKYRQFITNCFQIIPRHALHAKTLGFDQPTTKERMVFDSDLPDDMLAVLERWRVYTQQRKMKGEEI